MDPESRKNNRYSLGVAIYIKEIARGLVITMRHFLRNLIFRENVATIEYPDKKKELPEFYRGRHVLLTRENGEPRCVACFLCATNCPAQCISITAGEHPDPAVERFPEKFEIDLLKCVYCGFCVDACPKNAIALTHEYELACYSRGDSLIGKEELLKPPPGEVDWQKRRGEKT